MLLISDMLITFIISLLQTLYCSPETHSQLCSCNHLFEIFSVSYRYPSILPI
uniref:Uncharacterized protein n=1 Tax=Arundo donax TaxID=35708 RepID=A0A0A9ANL8_ARUDO